MDTHPQDKTEEKTNTHIVMRSDFPNVSHQRNKFSQNNTAFGGKFGIRNVVRLEFSA
jgi:hypothetical protein